MNTDRGVRNMHMFSRTKNVVLKLVRLIYSFILYTEEVT